MKKSIKTIILLIFSISILTGCWFDRFFNPGPQGEAVVPVVKLAPNTGKVMNAEYLKKEGKVFVVPFTAGVNAFATDELDKAALNIIKGISSILLESGSSLEIVTAEEKDDADFIIKGHVVEMTAPGKMRKWVLLNRKITLSVEGKLMDQESEEEVLRFYFRGEGHMGKEDYNDLGYQVGKDIGMFLLQSMK